MGNFTASTYWRFKWVELETESVEFGSEFILKQQDEQDEVFFAKLIWSIHISIMMNMITFLETLLGKGNEIDKST